MLLYVVYCRPNTWEETGLTPVQHENTAEESWEATTSTVESEVKPGVEPIVDSTLADQLNGDASVEDGVSLILISPHRRRLSSRIAAWIIGCG